MIKTCFERCMTISCKNLCNPELPICDNSVIMVPSLCNLSAVH